VGQPVEAYLAESWPECEAGVDARETWMRTRADELVPVSLSSTVLYDRQGYVVGRLLAVRDHREVVALRRRLVTSGRMAAVGELSAGIAHEVNNPVAYIHANLHLLERHAAELAKRGGEVAAAATEAGCCVGRCLEGIDAVAAIVRDVRGLSHADGDERRAVDLCALVGGVLRLAGQRLRHGRVDFACPMLPPVECAEQQVKQVFLDLVLNAARVTPEGGHIRIRGGRCDREVWVSVEDEGPPIPAAELTGLFDPLATNRAIREGRGLGLSVSYQILRQHGGRIEVDSPSECGTRVTLRWPIVGCGDEREGVDA
jgi:two-component system NtrC family sensor kinase